MSGQEIYYLASFILSQAPFTLGWLPITAFARRAPLDFRPQFSMLKLNPFTHPILYICVRDINFCLSRSFTRRFLCQSVCHLIGPNSSVTQNPNQAHSVILGQPLLDSLDICTSLESILGLARAATPALLLEQILSCRPLLPRLCDAAALSRMAFYSTWYTVANGFANLSLTLYIRPYTPALTRSPMLEPSVYQTSPDRSASGCPSSAQSSILLMISG